MPFEPGNRFGLNRASKYRPEFDDIAESTLGKGRSVASLGAEFGVSGQTIKGWIKRYKKFREAVERGESLRAAKIEEMLIAQAAGGKGIPAALIFLATNWTDLKNQQKHEISGSDGGPIVVQTKIPQPSVSAWKKAVKENPQSD